jgi:3-phosphoshikimate 1-carboxyvinyltransferase
MLLAGRLRVFGVPLLSAEKQLFYRVLPAGRLTGRWRVPGDKSISHRSIMLGAIAEGITEVWGFLEGEDSLATLRAFRDLGVAIEGPRAGEVRIRGVGLRGLRAAEAPLDLGNSGTSMRLLTGLLAGQGFASTLIGDASLSRRPMRRVTEPLARMGARIGTSEQGTAPLCLAPAERLEGIDYAMPVPSAQVKSCLLLAGLYAEGRTCVEEPAPTRDHTERMLEAFGKTVERRGNRVCVCGGGGLRACRIEIPADISSAAFFLVGASIAEGSDLTLEHVGINPTRIGVINILRAMGADIEVLNSRQAGGEPVGDLWVRSAPLRGIPIPADQVPLAIDEFPALFIAAACAEGETLLRGAEELRVKESDRIQVMAEGLQRLGIEAEPLPDGIRIRGGSLGAGAVQSHGDHRIAMAFAMGALGAGGAVEIADCANVNTSFPGFVGLARGAGLNIEEQWA